MSAITMSFFDIFKTADVNRGVKEFQNTPSAILLDVRTNEEYIGGHIPKSVNIPLQEIERANQTIAQKQIPIFVYCLSGGRSRQAQSRLQAMGYTNVKNIGGISQYNGEVEK